MKDINYEIGMAYARAGEPNAAAEFLEQSIKDGNLTANNDLGVLYEINHEYDKAAEYYQAAGCSGNAAAILNLGNLYENGLGVEKDYAKAKGYYLTAAKLGHTNAHVKLAKLYRYGLGVDVDINKVVFYLKKGLKIERRHRYLNTYCVCAIAWHYFTGEGVKKNIKKAIKYWRIASRDGNKNAAFNLALAYLHGDGVKQDIDHALNGLIRLACRGNYKDAICTLAEIFDTDEHGMKNTLLAGHFLLRGADKREVSCLLRIAEISLDEKWQDYGWSKSFGDVAVLDFLKEVNGKEKQYEDEIEFYKELKEKYINNIDWAYLETLPDSVNSDEEVC